MFTYIDQVGRKLSIKKTTERIISLVPSMTELLFDLGLGEKIVGVTKFCLYPNEVSTKTIVGGTKSVHYDKIKALEPDLIIVNKEENTKEIVETLEKDHLVWVTDVNTLDDLYEMITQLGQVLEVEEKAQALHQEIKINFSSIVKADHKKVLYLIWKEPYMAVGTSTFIDEMLKVCGFENAVEKSRYPEIQLSDYTDVDAVFLSSEPYPFKEKERKELQSIFPDSQIILVDGELFSWVGSRMKYAPAYFNDLITALK